MAINRLINGGSFGPEEIKALTEAFDHALHALGIRDRQGSEATAVASAVVDMAEDDMRDPAAIAERVIAAVRAARAQLREQNA